MGASCDSAGDIYVAGYTGADVNYDCLTMKLDTAGNTLWTATYGGSGDNEPRTSPVTLTATPSSRDT